MRRTFECLPVTLAFAVAVGACSSETASGFGSSSGGQSGDGGTTDAGAIEFPDSGSVPVDAAVVPQDGCSEAAKLVYVVSSLNAIYSFDPAALKFKKLFTLNCNVGAFVTPNSMAVDRDANAWVNFNDGSIHKVDLTTGACTSTSFNETSKGWKRFGMGFTTAGVGSTAETLYLNPMNDANAVNSNGLVSLDLTTMKTKSLGTFTGTQQGKSAELTGTGDGRLFGFFTTQPATLATINAATGATSASKSLTNVNTGSAWAFSFWGGDFWFYTASGLGNSSVTRLNTVTNAISVPVADAGFTIVGAGVSTCAPLVIDR